MRGHYQRTRKPEAERFWVKVDFGDIDGCWLWTASCGDGRYGQFRVYRNGEKTWMRAHRWAYEALVGPIPRGMELDHKCRVTRCVNPSHLEPVTTEDNLRRARRYEAINGLSKYGRLRAL